MDRLFSRLILAVMVGTVSCRKSPDPAASAPIPPAAHTNQQTFAAKGVIINVKPAAKEVEIKHEEIAGYMPAMTMPFAVKDTNQLAGLSPGDTVSFRMTVTDTDGWIDQIKKLSAAPSHQPVVISETGGSLPNSFKILRDVEPLKVGEPLPEYHLTNELGQAISTAQYKGGVLAITFIFTRCPFPTFCPFTAKNFADTQQKLKARADAPKNWRLLAISLDPEFDTPRVLKAYGQAYNYDPERWTLATGPLVDITALAEQFGLAFFRDDNGSITHNLRTVVLDASGRLQTTIIGNQWTSDELVDDMMKAGAKP